MVHVYMGGLSVFRSERLPSLKPKRDLTLGGVKKVSSVDLGEKELGKGGKREREREGRD